MSFSPKPSPKRRRQQQQDQCVQQWQQGQQQAWTEEARYVHWYEGIRRGPNHRPPYFYSAGYNTQLNMTNDGSISKKTIKLHHHWRSEKYHPYFQGLHIPRRTEMAKKCTKASTTTNSVFLPLDIVRNILPRLPAESVARLRCVCKDWMSLTYDPEFLKVQHKLALVRPVFIFPFLLGENIKFYDFNMEDMILKDWLVHMTLEGKNWRGSVQIGLSNSVDGLVCTYPLDPSSQRYCYLLNPTTRESTRIQIKGLMDWSNLHFGLGYDVSTGKYKLVCLHQLGNEAYWSCEVLTLDTSEWRHVGEVFCELSRRCLSPIFLNGVLHWSWVNIVGEANEPDFRVSMLTFDIKDEKLGMRTSSITTTFDDDSYREKFIEWRGHLCVILKGRLENYLEIWMLKDHGSDTWSKECVLASPYSTWRVNILPLTDEKLLVVTKMATYLHDLRRQTFHEMEGFQIGLDPVIHRESLISPRQLLSITNSKQQSVV